MQINDRYEFPDELDLDQEDGKWLSENADRNVRNLYKLHSVLVHSGGVHGGHYYAYIQPDRKRWLKFDDERVMPQFAPLVLCISHGSDVPDVLCAICTSCTAGACVGATAMHTSSQTAPAVWNSDEWAMLLPLRIEQSTCMAIVTLMRTSLHRSCHITQETR